MRQAIFDHLKNIIGWKTKRKIIVFAVDDYGNVRLDSKKARQELDKAGLKVFSRFDAFDTMETKEDLEALYEVLFSVKDRDGKPAVFTPYALPCNINFEAMEATGYKSYIYENIKETYSKLSVKDSNAYEGTWGLWSQGIAEGIVKPQFHGREHFNLKVFEEKLKYNDKELLVNLKNRSYTSISSTQYPTIGYTAAFAFQDQNDFPILKEILIDGVAQFEKVFGYKSTTFTPPAQQFPTLMLPILNNVGLKVIDMPLRQNLHLGNGKFKKSFNVLQEDKKNNCIKFIRNVSFEPTQDSSDHVERAFQQIKAAFFWNKPAIISSHRVNFCGYIDPNNRKKGLQALQQLLERIVFHWPEVEFMSSDKLGELIASSK